MPGWLLIFDNADPVADVRESLPATPLAAVRRGHVIVTTRRAGYAEIGEVQELDVIAPDTRSR